MPGGLIGTPSWGGLVGANTTVVELAALSVYGNATAATADAAAITASADNTFLGRQSNTLSFAALTGANITGFTAARIPYAAADGTLTQASEFQFTAASQSLGVGGAATVSGLDVFRSLSGATLTIAVRNTSNTASSAAVFLAEVAGGSANDAVYRSVVVGVTTWTWGIDNDDSDKWKISPGADIGSSTAITITTGGTVTIGTAALATNATAGHLHLTTSAGAPTGAVAAGAIHLDDTNGRLYYRIGATLGPAWYSTVPVDNSGRIDLAGRMTISRGTVASASAIAPPLATLVQVTGTTNIDHIYVSGTGNAGGLLILKFDGVLTVTDNAGSAPAGSAPIQLNGGVNLTTAADMLLFLIYDGVSNMWLEISRSDT